MKSVVRKIYYIPKPDVIEFKDNNIFYHDEMYDVFYNGETFSVVNKWNNKTVTTLSIPPDNCIMVKSFDDRIPEVEVFGPPSVTNNRYPLWLFLTWSRSRITNNFDKYESILLDKRREASIYEVTSPLVHIFYLVEYDDDFNIDQATFRKGYCWLDPRASSDDTANIVRNLFLRGIKGHDWIVNVLGWPHMRYDMILKDITLYDDPITLEEKLSHLNKYIFKET